MISTVVLAGMLLAGAGPAGADVTGLSGGAVGLEAGTLIPIAPTPTVTLPSGGGTESASALPIDIPGLVSVGALNVSTEGTGVPGPNGEATSQASAASADLLGLDIGAIESSCTSTAFGSTGGATVASITYSGIPIPGFPTLPSVIPANYAPPITVPGVASIIFNYQQANDSAGSTTLTVDGLYVQLLDLETIQVAQSVCGATGPDVEATPAVTGLTPNAGPTAGGTTVTITGTDFSPTSTVSFGGSAATTVVWVSSSELEATSPGHSAGPVDVRVTDQFGTSPITPNDQFTYEVAPTVSGVSPGSGPATGGTTVTVTGTNLTGGTVTIGGVVVVATCTPTSCTFVTPGGSPGQVTVTVTTPGGSAGGTFTYVAAPNVSSVSPPSGPAAGGTGVTITGTNLSGGTVTIGGTPVSATCASTSCTFTTPGGTPGPVVVTVTTVGGTDSGPFTYVAAPNISSLSPPSGPASGGTSVTITGTGLTDGTVVIGGVTVSAVCSAIACTFTTPGGNPGAVVVTVTTVGGTDSGTFTYIATPSVTSISPSSGPAAGGTSVTVTGTGFTNGVVTIGGVTVTATCGATTCTFITPGGTPGPVAVTVTTGGGTASNTFTYIAAPSITTIAPSSGPAAGGTQVTITGTGFTGGTVTIGGQTVVADCTDTSCTFTTPPGTPGPATVTVTALGGSGSGTFTYIAAPKVTSLSPSSGPAAGGTVVTITGTGLTNGVVTIGGVTVAANCTATSCTFTTPGGAPGPVAVTVTTGGGTGNGTFTYIAAPHVSSLSPRSGPTAGGTEVTISGTALSGGKVTLGGKAVSAACNATACAFRTPAHPAGPVTVTVTTAEGSSSGTFTYVAPAVPTITRISPPKGPSYGGTSVVVRGTNFSTKPGGTNFSFGGVDGTQVSCSSSTECTVITPIGLGTVLVRATVGTVTTARNSAATFMFVPGYYLVGARGDVYAFGDARNLGSVAGANLSAPVVGIAFDPATHGYWVAESNGRVTDFGAPGFVERPGHGSPRDIVAITSTPSGNGYWLVSSTGYVYPYGGAGYFGEIAPKKLSKPVLGIWSTATGKGYFLLASDGGIFNYGNAHFYGSTGAEHVASPVVGMSVDNITGGYWLVTAKGTVYNFNAPFFGDRTGKPLNRPVLGIIATPGGNGYYLVAGDGGVFAYGQATFFGSLGAKPPSSLVVGMSFEG